MIVIVLDPLTITTGNGVRVDCANVWRRAKTEKDNYAKCHHSKSEKQYCLDPAGRLTVNIV